VELRNSEEEVLFTGYSEQKFDDVPCENGKDAASDENENPEKGIFVESF
jgi:hypothetical protein